MSRNFASGIDQGRTAVTGLARGDGLGAEIGGVLQKIRGLLMLSYTIPPEEPGKPGLCVHAGIVELCSPHTIVVNRYGKRFADETFFQGIVPQLRHLDPMRHEYPNLPAFLIFDSQYLRKFSFANQPVGSDVAGTVPRAATLQELAARLGIDAEALAQTAERFNGFARDGVDPDFRRGENQWKLASAKAPRGVNASLGTLEQPPFYGVALHHRPRLRRPVGRQQRESSTSGDDRSRPLAPAMPPLPSTASAGSPCRRLLVTSAPRTAMGPDRAEAR